MSAGIKGAAPPRRQSRPDDIEEAVYVPVPPLDERDPLTVWARQLEALVIKNVGILWRKKFFLLIAILLPAIFLVLLYWIKELLTAVTLANVPLVLDGCVRFNAYGQIERGDATPCITVMFAPETNGNASAVMRDVATSTGLHYGTDIVGASTSEALVGYQFDHPGVVDMGVIFHANFSWDVIEYDVLLNSTAANLYGNAGIDKIMENQEYNGRLLALQKEIDAAIISRVMALEGHTGPAASIDVGVGGFSQASDGNLFDSATVPIVQLAGGSFIVVGVVVVALLLLNLATSEKAAKLLGALRVAGLWESTHWLSWFVAFSAMIMVPGAFLAVGVGGWLQISLFTQCDTAVHLVTLPAFSLAMCAYALWMASYIRRPRWTNTASFFIFSIAVVMTFMFSTMGNLFDLLYSPSITLVVKMILWPMPWFHYGRIVASIFTVLASASHGGGGGNGALDAAAAVGSHPRAPSHYTWDDFTTDIGPYTAEVNGANVQWYAPSAAYNASVLFSQIAVYLLLSWYFSQVFAGDLGASQPFTFVVSKRYWGIGRRGRGDNPLGAAGIQTGDTIAQEQFKSFRDNTVRVHKMSKSYDTATALKEVSLEFAAGQTTAVLGVNGAGKSTLMNCLGGLLTPTHGEAFVFGQSVREDISELRNIMGNCPQHSLLWPELSARAHVALYARFKCVSRSALSAHVDNILAAVGLLDEGDAPAHSFSGGMKRRLSLACAAVGDPKLIFMDEPTTGMDALAKSRCWALINQLKHGAPGSPGRVVILSSHDMHEAQELGDTIAILANGRMRAHGSSLFLCNRFGSGYQINLLCDADNSDELKALVSSSLPGADVVGDAAGSLTVGLPRRNVHHLPAFLRLLHSRSGDGDLVKEYGVGNSTLEEAFLRLAGQQDGVNEVAVDFTDGAVEGSEAAPSGPRMCVLCEERKAEPANLFTGKGITVMAPDLVCPSCAVMEPADYEELLRRRGVADTAAAAAAAPAVAAGEASDSKADGGFDAPASATTAGATTTTTTTTVTGDGTKDGFGGRTDSKSPPVAPYVGVAASPATADDRTLTTGSKDGAGAAMATAATTAAAVGAPGAPKPVSILTQAAAVCAMRLTIRSKSRKTAAAQVGALVLGMLITWLVTPAAPKRGQLCPGGYLKNPQNDYGPPSAAVFDLCNRTQFIDYTLDIPDSGVMHGLPYQYSYNELCAHWDIGGGCLYDGDVMMADWTQTRAIQPNGVNLFQNSHPPPVRAWYTDATQAGSSPLSDFDLLGFGKGVLNVTGQVRFEKRPAGQDIDATVFAAQESVVADATDMSNTACQYYSDTSNGVMKPNGMAAWEFMSGKFPDFGVEMKASDIGNKRFAYDVLTYAPAADYGAAQVFWVDNSSGYDNCNSIQAYSPANSYNQYGFAQMPVVATLSAMHSGFLRTLAGDGRSNPANDGNARAIRMRVGYMPDLDFEPVVQPVELGFQSFLFPLFSMFLLPGFVAAITQEKSDNLFQMMRTEGMKPASYWLGLYAYHLVMTLIVGSLLVALGYVFSLATYLNTSVTLFMALFLAWSHAQSGLSFLLASVLNRGRVATVMTVLLVVLVSITSAIMSSVWTKQEWPALLQWATPFGFARAATITLQFGGNTIYWGSELANLLLMMMATGTACGALGMYLHSVIPSEFGSYAHAFGPCISAARCLCPRRLRHRVIRAMSNRIEMHSVDSVDGSSAPLLGGSAGGSNLSLGSGGGAAAAARRSGSYGAVPVASAALDLLGGGDKEDEDVVEERERVRRGRARDGAITINNLVKVYPPQGGKKEPKVAVAGLTLGVGYGEAFALLGPNGAGKSTTITMLCGGLLPTRGRATVGGYDIATQMDLVFTQLGVCPQFDAPIPDLTVEDHLLYYARLKGVAPHEQIAAVQRTAERVRLDGDSFRTPAAQLSGGQLRRMSIGISLIGDPRVVILDEPTTGVDPGEKRKLWDIIREVRESGVAVLMATHDLHEAEVLSNRIGIMCYGSLRVIGSQLRLKRRFGQGYTLSLSLTSQDDAAVARADAFVRAHASPDARLASRVNANLSFMLPPRGVDIADVFATFEAGKAEAGIVDFGLSQTSLDQVFVNVVKAAEAQHEESAAGAGGGGGGAGAAAGDTAV